MHHAKAVIEDGGTENDRTAQGLIMASHFLSGELTRSLWERWLWNWNVGKDECFTTDGGEIFTIVRREPKSQRLCEYRVIF